MNIRLNVHARGAQLVIRARRLHLPVVKNDDEVALLQELNLVGRQKHSLAPKPFLYALVEHRVSHVRVYGGERVVQQVDIGAGVEPSSKTNSCFLPSAQIDALYRERGK